MMDGRAKDFEKRRFRRASVVQLIGGYLWGRRKIKGACTCYFRLCSPIRHVV